MEKRTMKTLISVILLLVLMGATAWGFTRNCKAATYGWNSNKNGVYFIKDNGKPYQGFMEYNGQWFYFIPETGYMLTGWQWSEEQNSPIRYFSKQDGHMYTGWITTSEGTRFFDRSNGVMAQNVTIWIDGSFHKFDAKGIDITEPYLY